jgi:predicted DNA-binding transcriptional regulator AlpA
MNNMIPSKTLEVTLFPDGRMSTSNAATYTGLAEKTLAMMRCNGKGPKFIKMGRIFYFQSDIDTWINANERITSTSQTKPDASQVG